MKTHLDTVVAGTSFAVATLELENEKKGKGYDT